MRTILIIILVLLSFRVDSGERKDIKFIIQEEKEIVIPYIQGTFNNNPFNLRGKDDWLGKVKLNKGYIKFESMEYGIRAGLINLQNQKKFHSITSVKTLINKYAPPFENNTERYINKVIHYLGNNTINLDNKDELIEVAYIICIMESKKIDKEILILIYNKYLKNE